ncbi:MAG: hypothetical protein JNK19_11125 [Tabrizicola sp.]|nr:hypothetical protein [Tabrizicola sp.]
MTFSPATPAPISSTKPAERLLGLILMIKVRIARIGLPTRLDRMSEDQLKDISLLGGDSGWLRCHGSSQDAATQLAIRAGVRAGNW